MQSFDDRAIAHFLDFTRDRAVRIELDPPALRLFVPTANEGDKRGAKGLFAKMARREPFDVLVHRQPVTCTLERIEGLGGDEVCLCLEIASDSRAHHGD